ncbi:MAG: hypothetical protein WCO07_03205 [bacterium]
MDAINSFNSGSVSLDPILNSSLSNPDYFFNKIMTFFRSSFETINFILVGNVLNAIFFILAIIFLFVICYSAIRVLELRKKEHEYLHHEIEEYAHKYSERAAKDAAKNGTAQSVRWGTVLEHISSTSQADWKLAIMDADSMLEELLDQLGFQGENLGDKLKSVDMEKYSSLKPAWDAHIIRNKIAHEGIQFEISQREAERVISIYEQIFKDFRYI